MVLLTYQEESYIRGASSLEKDKERAGKHDGPKTAYLDKLYAFKEIYADEEKCDLFFICQDGEIPAHRLVISNASKYIMAMQDDQPPWYPVYISVPDLTKEIVQTLVRLAYTGQMEIPPGTTTEELLDAMQALGWINTDCLTATYLDSSGVEEDFGLAISSKESLEEIMKRNMPANPKAENDTSDDDDGMEVALPDVPMSDEESKLDSPKGKRGARARGKKVPPPKIATPVKTKVSPRAQAKPKPVTPAKPAVVTAKTTEEPVATGGRRGARKADQNEANDATPVKNKQVEATAATNAPVAVASPEPEAVRSRTRTIRKPKKFDDDIVMTMTPTKRKESPTKAQPTKVTKPSTTEKEKKETAKTPKKNSTVAKTASNDVNSASTRGKNRTTSTESKDSPRNSLITSYFNKRSPSNSKNNDTSTAEDEKLDEPEPVDGLQQSNSSQNDECTNNDESVTNDDADNSEDKKGNNTASLRKRARSNASTKSDKDKDGTREEVNEDPATPTSLKRTRSSHDTTEKESESPKTNPTPTRRGRKASSVSNASKSSNKDPPATENDVEDVENGTDSARKKRIRQE